MGGGLLSSALALTLTVTTILSGTTDVRAAEITDKPEIDLEITGNYTEKKISDADVTALAKAFGYDTAATSIYICSDGTTASVDWSNSSVAHWQVYETEVFQPELSRDAEGNLIVGKDENGKLAVSKDGIYGYAQFLCTDYENTNNISLFTSYERFGGMFFNIASYEGQAFSEQFVSNIQKQFINQNLGAKKVSYDNVEKEISDVYVIRFYYSTDDKINVSSLELAIDIGFGLYDVNGNYWDFEQMSNEECQNYKYNDRTYRYADFWILPEGVDTVLTLEDTTNNVPSDTPSNDNSSNDSSNENNKPNDSTNNTPSDSNTPSDDTTSNDSSNDTITTPTKPYEFDLSAIESQTVSKEDFAAILEVNKDNDVVIKSNNGVTFTFARGTMTEVDGKESYDFSTSINNIYTDTMPSYIQKNSFVSQINFNYSGKLPAMASIRFYVGTDYAGKTLYYSLMNEDNTFAEVKSYVVDAEGYMTVWQDHCSSYVVTTEEPKQQETTTPPADNKTDTNAGTTNNANNTNNTDNAVTSPKTNDMTKMLVPIAGVLLLAVGGVFVGMKKRKMM